MGDAPNTDRSARTSVDNLMADEQAVALAELEEYLEHLPRERDAAFFAKLRGASAPVHGETLGRPSRRTARRRA